MNLQDLKTYIKTSQNIEMLNQLEFTAEFPNIKESYHLVGLYNIYKFYYDQAQKWTTTTLENKYHKTFIDSIDFFDNAKNALEAFIFNYVVPNNITDENLQYYFTQIHNSLLPRSDIFTNSSPTVDFLQRLYDNDPDLFTPALNYITNNNLNSNSEKNPNAYFLAYEFENSENSFVFNKRESEKKALSKIRSEMNSLSNDYNNEVIKFQKDIKESYHQYDRDIEKRKVSYRKVLAEWLLARKSSYSQFLESSESDFLNLFDSTKDEFYNLKNQYGKLLQLQEPMQYWKARATELNSKADKILILILIGIVSFMFAILVYVLLWFTPEGLLESLFSGDKSKAIRWSFVFIIFVSIFFVVIKALLKFMFSNYHLARDAEEREKLTYLYISLLSKGDFSEEEKKIVFQALFSRSDTGLLKEDSSPTMPGVASVFERMK